MTPLNSSPVRITLTEQPPAKAGGLVLRTKVSDTGRIDPFRGQF